MTSDYEVWLVGVWDGMGWDGSHRFQCKLNSSHQNHQKNTDVSAASLCFPTVGGIGSILFNWKSCDEISTEPLAGSNISKGREFSAKFSKFSFTIKGRLIFAFWRKIEVFFIT